MTTLTRRTSRRRSLMLSFALVLAGAAASPALAQDAPPDPAGFGERRVTLHPALSGHRLLPVMIDGTGPYTFLLDTGANNTAIAQPVAESLGFVSRWDRYGDVQALTTRFEAERFHLLNVSYAEGVAPVDLYSVVIPVADSQPMPVAGLLGADAIRSPRYTIDFAGAELRLDTTSPRHADGEAAASGLLLGRADMRGLSDVRVMFDSGTARTLVNPRLERRVRNRGMVVRMNVGGIDGRVEEEAQPVILRDLQIGGLCIEGIAVLEADLDIFSALGWEDVPAMVVGMDVLQFARIDVDRDRGVIQVEGGIDEVSCAR